MRESTLNLIITVVSGVLVYVFSQLFTEFVLRPIQDYKRLKAKVAKELVYYAQFYSNPQPIGTATENRLWTEASDALRVLASEVTAFAEIKPFHPFAFYVIPSRKNLREASKNLIGLSNSLFVSDGSYYLERKDFPEKVKRCMKISCRKCKKGK